jgi:hypothetical protein
MIDIAPARGRLAWRRELHIGSKAGGLAAASLHKFPKKSIYGKLARPTAPPWVDLNLRGMPAIKG